MRVFFYITTNYDPQNLWITSAYRGNQFYVREQTGYGRTLIGFGVVLGSALVVATAESMSQIGNNTGK